MRLKVSSNVPGEITFPSLGDKRLKANSVFSVTTAQLSSGDIQYAILKGYLKAIDPLPEGVSIQQTSVKIRNISHGIIPLLGLAIKPGEIAFLKESDLEIDEVRVLLLLKKMERIQEEQPKEVIETVVETVEEIQKEPEQPKIASPPEQEIDPISSPETTMQAWDFDKQIMLDADESKDATIKSPKDITPVVAEPHTKVQVGDVDFSDEVDKVHPKSATKKKSKKKSIKKEASTNGKTKSTKKTTKKVAKKVKVKPVVPSGEQKPDPLLPPIGAEEAERNRDLLRDPNEPRPSEVVKDIVNRHLPPDDISFVDQEQEAARTRSHPKIAGQNSEIE